MHRSLLELLVCPACRVALAATVHEQAGEEIESAFLRCPRCAIVVPVLDGLVLFTEPLLHEGLADAEALRAMALRLFGSAQAYIDYRRDKRQRGVIESYAAFAPFNESTRSIEPVLPHAVAGLRARDCILDTWCRTGWSGEWLAARFPDQRVVSLWEGNSSVLGYRGFRHLLGSGQRAGNLDIVFCHLDKPLPFRDGAFGMVHAYDSLHRYGLLPFAGECLRVAREDAAILFPHLHLSNSEPEPFFERGCQQHHGRDYRAWLDRVASDGRRRGWVFSEATLFNGPDVAVLVDDPDTRHYNGMVAILPEASSPVVTMPCDQATRRFLVSPLFRLHPGRGTARVAPGLFDSAVGHLLERHPIYRARLPAEPVSLSETALLALLLATVAASEDDIAGAFTPASDGVASVLQAMTANALLHPAAISVAGHRLQRFHGNQLPIREGGVLQGFWSRIAGCEAELLLLAEGDGLAGPDLSRFAASTSARLQGLGLKPGDWLSADAVAHPLLLLAAIVAASSGLNVRLLSAATPLHPESKLLLGDANGRLADVPCLPLGLDGAAPSLLSGLESQPAREHGLCRDDAGLVEFDIDEGRACCRLAELVDAIDSLSAQIDERLWLLEGRSRFADLIACLAAWARLETVRSLPVANA